MNSVTKCHLKWKVLILEEDVQGINKRR